MSEPLFRSTHAALAFAHNFSGSTLDRPLMNRLADKPSRSAGRGLVGLDGAAQAGMILRELGEMSRLHRAIYVCRYAPRTSDCPCCGSAVPSAEWMAAVREVSDAAMVAGVLSGHVVMRVVRDGIVARFFGQKVHLQELAAKASISVNTVTDHNSRIVLWLRGSRTTKGKTKGEREAGTRGMEDIAMDAADAALRNAGIVGDSD